MYRLKQDQTRKNIKQMILGAQRIRDVMAYYR